MPTSFGTAIPVTGPLLGFPGVISRTGAVDTSARPVLPTAAHAISFGAGVVLIGSTNLGGNWESISDYLATASNAQYLQANFAGIAIRNVMTMTPFSAQNQNALPASATTAGTASSGSTSLTVASATGIVTGMSVQGINIQPNTLVSAISGTTVTLSLATLGALSSNNVVFTGTVTPAVGSYAQGIECEILERGSITVNVTNGTPAANGAVYIRTVANSSLAGTSIGDFEAADDVVASPPTTTTTVGSTTLTVSSGTGLAIGQRVTGPGIPVNTYLVSGATTSWVMSNAATATTSTATSAFSNMCLLGDNASTPWIVFRTGVLDANNIAEVTIKVRHAA